ncbi:MAG: amidase [Proteobacteria bacterium]|nr:amidase [Pseudomonadota bacterium]
MTEAHELTATEGLKAMDAGNLTAEGWLASCIERVDAREETVRAWEYLDRDGALKRAREMTAAGNGGLAAGVPFGAKDIIDTHDMPTGYGSPIHTGHRPGRDAGCVAITRAAGAVLLGKTVTTEFGHRYPGKTRNPFNPAYTPGGSSSGSAAAVGDKMVPMAFGTQTGGSVIRPATYCGTVGYKPTFEDINRNGVLPNSPSFDTVGIITRSVEDLALFRSVVLEEPLRAIAPPAISDLKFGFYRTPNWDKADAATHGHIEGAAQALAAAGASVMEISLPGEADYDALHTTIAGFEFARTVAWERLNRLDQLSSDLRDGRMQNGVNTSYEDYRKATMRLEHLKMEVDAALGEVDAVICPAAPGEALEGHSYTGTSIFNGLWTMLGTPAVTLPLFTGPNGLPMGLQLVAGRTKDRRLFDVAEAVYRALS